MYVKHTLRFWKQTSRPLQLQMECSLNACWIHCCLAVCEHRKFRASLWPQSEWANKIISKEVNKNETERSMIGDNSSYWDMQTIWTTDELSPITSHDSTEFYYHKTWVAVAEKSVCERLKSIAAQKRILLNIYQPHKAADFESSQLLCSLLRGYSQRTTWERKAFVSNSVLNPRRC